MNSIVTESIATRLVDIEKAWSAAGYRSKSQYYRDVRAGLMVRPILLSPRCALLPAHEVEAVNRARIAGANQADMRKLVEQLHAARKALQAAPIDSEVIKADAEQVSAPKPPKAKAPAAVLAAGNVQHLPAARA